MRLVAYGAGAVGGVVGGLLHRAGHDVTLVARGAHLAALRDTGLRLVTPLLDVTQRIPVVAGPDEIVWTGDEVVLVAVKSDATSVVATLLATSAPPSVSVVSLQNGVSNEATLAGRFPSVYGVCVMAPTTHLEPGVVRGKSAEAPAVLDIGRWPSGVDDTCQAVAAAFGTAGLVSQTRDDIMAWKHRKLLVNLGNVVDAFCAEGPAAEALTELLIQEGETVLAAAGIPVVSSAADAERRGDLLRRGPSDGPTGSSTWQSLARGTGNVETDHLNGEIVRLGADHGVPTPLNSRLVELAHHLLSQGAEPRSADASTLLD